MSLRLKCPVSRFVAVAGSRAVQRATILRLSVTWWGGWLGEKALLSNHPSGFDVTRTEELN